MVQNRTNFGLTRCCLLLNILLKWHWILGISVEMFFENIRSFFRNTRSLLNLH